ncbi:hypothetical protein RRSWK_06156 [Rhodopirellula sp. SWK7]|nr:hypothetical protein RRSWK_06156 [Rhodopirellula sp. SWK7]
MKMIGACCLGGAGVIVRFVRLFYGVLASSDVGLVFCISLFGLVSYEFLAITAGVHAR